MKSDQKQNTPGTKKITIEPLPDAHARLVKMAAKLGTTTERIAEGLLDGMPEDFLGRWGDTIWLSVAYYIDDVYGGSAKFKKQLRFLRACKKRSDAASRKRREQIDLKAA